MSKVVEIEKIAGEGGSIQVPGGDPGFQTGRPMQSLTDAEIKDLLDIEAGLVVFGRIDYSSTNGTEYWSRFCLLHQKNGAAGFCPTGYSQMK
jgi:hypothetical protein